jgi:Rod binding domain-containing protein
MQMSRSNPLTLAANVPDALRLPAMPSAAQPFKLSAKPRVQALGSDGQIKPVTDKDPLREAAEQLVSTSLLQPLLKQSHADPFKSKLFHGGQAEEMFTQQLDEQMADRMSTRMSMPIVDAIYRQYSQQASAGKGVDQHG